jgi:hypothetical protein
VQFPEQQSPPFAQEAPPGRQAATRVTGLAMRVDRAKDWFGVLSAKSGPATHTTKAIAMKSPNSNFKFLMRCLLGTEGMSAVEAIRCAALPVATPVGFAASIILQGKALAYVSRGTRP